MPEIPECCKGCIKWEKFGKDCWVYWELKKQCSHFTTEEQFLQQQNSTTL